jgi:hypothetical protein
MTLDELNTYRAAAAKAVADLEAARAKQRAAAEEITRLSDARKNLPLIDAAIEKQLAAEKGAALRLEIIESAIAAMASNFVTAKDNLAKAEFEFEDEALQRESDALAQTLRGKYMEHATELTKILAAVAVLENKIYSFHSRARHASHGLHPTVTPPSALVRLFRRDGMVLSGVDLQQLWPVEPQKMRELAEAFAAEQRNGLDARRAIAESLDLSIG